MIAKKKINSKEELKTTDIDTIQNIQNIMTSNPETIDNSDIIELTKVVHENEHDESIESNSQRKRLITDIQASLSDLKQINTDNTVHTKDNENTCIDIKEPNSLKNILKKEIEKACEDKNKFCNHEEESNPRIKNFVENCIKKSANEWVNSNIEILVENWISNNLAYILQDILTKWLANDGKNAIKELLKQEIEIAMKDIYSEK